MADNVSDPRSFQRRVGGGSLATWLPFALLSLAGWGLWGFLQKPLTDRMDVWSVAFYEGATNLVLAVAAALCFREKLSFRIPGVQVALIAGTIGYFGNLALLLAVDRGTASIVVPITSMYPVVSIGLGLAFLKESMTGSQKVGVALALASVVLLST
jgi:transporter family protein